MESTTPKILCLTGSNPAGPDNGGILRVRNIFRLLSRLGRVRLVLAGDHPEEPLQPSASLAGLELVDVVQFQPSRWSAADYFRNEFDARFLNTNAAQARPADRERLQQLIASHRNAHRGHLVRASNWSNARDKSHLFPL